LVGVASAVAPYPSVLLTPSLTAVAAVATALIVAFHPTLTESLTPVTKWLNPLSCADTKVRSVYLNAALVA
jgi:streptomycin 6-kinase